MPDKQLSNDELARLHPDWDVDKVASKTGIYKRFIASEDETAVDLGIAAGAKLLAEYDLKSEDIDSLIFVTQSPDYALPTSACIIQNELGLRRDILAFDINLGCSGFVNSLSVASGLIATGSAQNCLLICAETYSKYIHPEDRTNKMIFSDAGAACFIETDATNGSQCGNFVFGSDGSGGQDLIVKGSGARHLKEDEDNHLFMHGSNVLMFTMREIPLAVENCLKQASLTIDDVDLFVFHQASNLVLDTLTAKLQLAPEKVFNNLGQLGNTVSCTIPIALKGAIDSGDISSGKTVMLVGFGVGLSWGACLVKWGAT